MLYLIEYIFIHKKHLGCNVKKIEILEKDKKSAKIIAPDDSQLGGHSSCSLGRGHTGAITKAKDVCEPLDRKLV